MDLEMILIITLLMLAVINDLYSYKVKNEITFSFAIIGIIYNLVFGSLQNFYSSILGMTVPFIILLPLYINKMLGAGDIKLFCALGAFVGFNLIIVSIGYSFIAGAIIAIILMLARKNMLQRFKYFFQYIRSCLLCLTLIPYDDLSVKQNGAKMHFTIPIALGTMLVLLL